MYKRTVKTLLILFSVVPVFGICAKNGSTHSKDKRKAYKTKLNTTSDPNSSNKRQGAQPDYFSISYPVPSSRHYIDVTNPGHGLPQVINDGNTDNTRSLQAIIDSHSGSGKILYFPPGRYLIASDITIKTRLRLVGSQVGISLIETESPKARVTTIGNTLADGDGQIHVDYLFFDGVNLRFGHKNHQKSNIFVSHCVFFSRNIPGNRAKHTVRFQNISNQGASERSALGFSVFLRDEHAFDVATNVQKSYGITIRNNIYGLDLGRVDWMDTELSNSYWSGLKSKLIYLKTTLSLRDDQGYFNSSIYCGFSNKSLIEKNIFNGSPNSASLKHDHVVYLKGFDGMKFLENYARGWPSTSSGGIKARNGKNLVIARNYIDDTGILMYTHLNAKPGVTIYKGLTDVLVYGNHIVQRTNQGHPKNGIIYYEPDFAGQDENANYSANIFEIIGGQSPPTEDCIFLSNGNLAEHHVYEDNVYYGTAQKVGIHHRHHTPSYATGNISPDVIAPYQSMTLPKYNIPTYA